MMSTIKFTIQSLHWDFEGSHIIISDSYTSETCKILKFYGKFVEVGLKT